MTPHFSSRQALRWGGLILALASCQSRNPLSDLPDNSVTVVSSGSEWLEDARVAYGMRMDVETYTYRVVENYGAGTVKSFTDIAAAPQLYRRLIESRVMQDGSYELITTQLKPQHLDKLPVAQRNWTEQGPHRSVVQNNRLTLYDGAGNVIGEHSLKPINHAAQLEEMRRMKEGNPVATRMAAQPTGYPTLDPTYFEQMLKANAGQVRWLKPHLAQIRQEQRTQDASAPSSQYTLSVFDVKNRRLLRSEVYDAASNRLLQRSICQYNREGDSFRLKGVYSETFRVDAKTGEKVKEVSQQFMENVTFVNNI
jgi:hypothetical protein